MACNTDIATRAAVVALKAASGKTSVQIAGILGLNTRRVNEIYARAIERGFEPNAYPLDIRDEFVQDAPHSGRSARRTDEVVKGIVVKQYRNLGHDDVAHLTQGRVPQNEDNEDAWVDTEDEKEEARMLPC